MVLPTDLRLLQVDRCDLVETLDNSVRGPATSTQPPRGPNDFDAQPLFLLIYISFGIAHAADGNLGSLSLLKWPFFAHI
jgi:hypothetical protein